MKILIYSILVIAGFGTLLFLQLTNLDLTDRELQKTFPGTIQLATGYLFFGLGGLTELLFKHFEPKRKSKKPWPTKKPQVHYPRR